MNKSQEPHKFEIETDPPAPDFRARANLIRKIITLGYDEKTAAHFARLITEKPVVDTDGAVLVIENGKVRARLMLTIQPEK
jgi:hypothetical protein